MLVQEAQWLGRSMASLPPDLIFPLLNIGSGTEDLRTRRRPWINGYIFEQFVQQGQQITHVDMKEGDGVDMVGDLTDPDFLAKLAAMSFKSVLCTNLFEHVPNKEELAGLLLSVIPRGGYVFATCPYAYPYHPDPIDTMFRPDIEELCSVFPNTTLKNAEIVSGDRYIDQLAKQPRELVRLLMPLYKPKAWLGVFLKQFWLFRRFRVTCVVLEKN